jgi:hypothetical protein
MSETEKRKRNISELIRYHTGDMTDKERNAFERELERDPFLADAAEGLEQITHDEALADVEGIKHQLIPGTRKRSLLVYSGAAAAVLLLVISSYFIFRIGDSTIKEPLLVSGERLQEADTTGFIAPDEKTTTAADTGTGMSQTVIKPVTESMAGISQRSISKDTISKQTAVEEIAPPQTVPVLAAARSSVVSAMAALPDTPVFNLKRAEADTAVTSISPRITGTVFSAEDSLPIAGVFLAIKGSEFQGVVSGLDGSFSLPVRPDSNTILVARFIGMEPAEIKTGSITSHRIEMRPSALSLDEVIVVGFASEKQGSLSGVIPGVRIAEAGGTTEYAAPEPVQGFSAFRDYIRENLIYPPGIKGSQREIVVIDLPLSATGTKGTPRIIRSAGEKFSAEAIRLIMEGPEWKPLIVNGKPTEDTIRIRIVFRRELLD